MIGRTANVRDTQCIEDRSALRDSPLRPGDEPPLGSHLVTRRAFYSHHGIYSGEGRVIHYGGFALGVRRRPVEEVSLERFAHGHRIRIRHDRRCFNREEVVERAQSRLGENRYDVLRNNCEHFCAWALRDETHSRQVERLTTLPRAVYQWIEHLQNAIVWARLIRLDRVRGAGRTMACPE